MRLYSGTVDQFVNDTIQNQIAEKLRAAFLDYYRHYPGPSEVQSWRNSLRAQGCHSVLPAHGPRHPAGVSASAQFSSA